MHPRDGDGQESLQVDVVDAVVRQVRNTCGVPVGVSTGDWIEPDLRKRLALISQWSEPDYASVNVSEEGAFEVMRALKARGIGVEAGVWTPEDAQALNEAKVADTLTRILIEPVGADPATAVELVTTIRAQLDIAPLLQHGDGSATWVLLEDAARNGLDTRIGLEDTLEADNPALVRRAMSLIAGTGL
jgi:uncharacterized protein (DUF849 family)